MARFGRYEILGKLGEGAMGVVHRAHDHALGRVVALKMLSAELGGDEELQVRFAREAEAIGRLSHPNIVSVYDLGESEGHLYMAMELLEGDDLRALMERKVEVPLADRVRIMAQICDGLGYAHSRGVVHRDVKPANIVVTTAGKVKVLDFGLARIATRETITRVGIILGTPDYMSPEQASGLPLDHRTDIFSAGAVFYEFLCREKPFRGKTLHSVLYQIISDQPDPLMTRVPELPARLCAVVHRLLVKDREERYQTLEEAGRDLMQIHDALRRSRSRSALPPPEDEDPGSDDDEARERARGLVNRGRSHLQAGRVGNAVAELAKALALDPRDEEAAEYLWNANSKLAVKGRPEPPQPSKETAERIGVLLTKAAPGSPEADARRALAELALLAPDDPRFAELVRERSGKDRER
jgi:serine/threonine protein kinase